MGSKLVIAIFGAILVIGGIFFLASENKSISLPSGTSEEAPTLSVQPTASETENVQVTGLLTSNFSSRMI